MDSGIYLITNITNGKGYVGSSKALRSRRYTHFRDLRKGSHHNAHLKHAWDQCGAAAFHFAVLEYCSKEDLLEREDWWMDLLRSRERQHGYNLWDAERHECSEETRAKLRAVVHSPAWFEKQRARVRVITPEMRARSRAPEVLAKRAASNTGKKRTAETKQKIGAANSGKSPSAETRSKMSESAKQRGGGFQTGHEVPDEWRLAHSALMKGRTPPNKGMPMSAAAKAKLSAAKKGRSVHTEAHKAALADQMRQRWTPERRAKMSERMKGNTHAKPVSKYPLAVG